MIYIEWFNEDEAAVMYTTHAECVHYGFGYVLGSDPPKYPVPMLDYLHDGSVLSEFIIFCWNDDECEKAYDYFGLEETMM